MVTVPVAGSNTGGLRSASAKESASGPTASRFTSASTLCIVSVSSSWYGGLPSTSCRRSTSNRLNSMSRRLLL